ncbi:helix-turn-helix domain-containing protein [Aliarcobacter cryaerophilus]|uniref:helix-turn-helix domain-containing protein n=1 Tax=Aliarcobacter cryaerophilus TaxID=28198 RepID=UPI0021B355CB|nr:helix-turn-helix domain-containing protein [Aliarcobacter cryaerophilus]MCT7508700.1 helix-turn-helix domain-containing protein [Aliarcobacter cryaerophilus]
MNINEEIKEYMQQINNLGFEKILNLNSKQTAGILGVSASTVEAWRKQGIGVDYIEVGGRILYPKLKIAEFQANRKIKTA